jgi:hypothetical protein
VFVSLIITLFRKEKIQLESSIKEPLLPEKKTLKTYLLRFANILRGYVIPILFYVVLVLWTILLLIPSTYNSLLPADSSQNVILKNFSDTEQDVILLGRLSYSNDWILLKPYNPMFQLNYIQQVRPNGTEMLTLRTGVNDIDYLMIANVTNGKYNPTNSMTMQVPRNDVVCFTDNLDILTTISSPALMLFNVLLPIILFLAAIVGFVWLFLKYVLSISEQRVKRIIIASVVLAIPVAAFGYLGWLNVQTLFLFVGF